MTSNSHAASGEMEKGGNMLLRESEEVASCSMAISGNEGVCNYCVP